MLALFLDWKIHEFLLHVPRLRIFLLVSFFYCFFVIDHGESFLHSAGFLAKKLKEIVFYRKSIQVFQDALTACNMVSIIQI